ncbi:hypothetical protein Tco_0744842 [Tanacetum coccineum]
MPHESPLQSVHSLGRDEGSLSLNDLTVQCTTLSKNVEDLQNDLKQTKVTYGAAFTKLILRVKKLEHKVKGRKISDIDTDPTISLIQEEGMTWFQEDADIQEKNSVDTKILLQEEEPTELVENQGSREKGEKEVSTVGAEHSTIIPEVSTAAANLVYIRRSEKREKIKEKLL